MPIGSIKFILLHLYFSLYMDGYSSTKCSEVRFGDRIHLCVPLFLFIYFLSERNKVMKMWGLLWLLLRLHSPAFGIEMHMTVDRNRGLLEAFWHSCAVTANAVDASSRSRLESVTLPSEFFFSFFLSAGQSLFLQYSQWYCKQLSCVKCILTWTI
jgi:hypothetical protein